MFFDILKSEQSCMAECREFIQSCIECEKKVRIEPDDAMMMARTLTEKFVNYVLEKNGIEIPDDKDEKKNANLDGIKDKITKCSNEEFINEFQASRLNDVRYNANNIVHPSKTKTKNAADVFRSLYLAVVSYALGEPVFELSEKEKRPPRTNSRGKVIEGRKGYDIEDLLPIGEYEVISPMFSTDAPSDKIRTYRCKKVSMIENREVVQYAIIRCFNKDMDEDIRQYRDIMALNEIKRNYANLERQPILAEEIATSPKCRFRFLCYITAEDTFLLSQEKRLKKYYSSQNCENITQQVAVRLKIVRDIAEILYDLIDIDENKSIHHRNLRPECVFVTPTRKGCKVSLGNFEYSKVEDGTERDPNNPTLKLDAHAKTVMDDPFAPPELKGENSALLSEPDWEQVDIYSLARIVVWLIFNSTDEDRLAAQLEDLKKFTSSEFAEITAEIINNPYPSRPTFKEYLKAINMELIRLE